LLPHFSDHLKLASKLLGMISRMTTRHLSRIDHFTIHSRSRKMHAPPDSPPDAASRPQDSWLHSHKTCSTRCGNQSLPRWKSCFVSASRSKASSGRSGERRRFHDRGQINLVRTTAAPAGSSGAGAPKPAQMVEVRSRCRCRASSSCCHPNDRLPSCSIQSNSTKM
jgi:hypothetical protein